MSNVFLQRTNCPACESNQIQEFLNIPFTETKLIEFISTYYKSRVPITLFDNERFIIHHCNNCKLTYQARILMPEYMQQLYDNWICPKESLEKKINAKRNTFLTYSNEAKLIATLIKKPINKIKVLDYGMGWGHWLNMAKAHGYQTTGVEISKPRISYALKNGHRVLNEISNDEDYDFIIANQVFEHLSHPSIDIKKLSNALSPGGALLISVPQGNKYSKLSSFSNYQPKKDSLHPLEHVNCFNRNSLSALASNCELKQVQLPFNLLSKSLSEIPKSILRYIYDTTTSTRILLRKTE